MEEEKEFFEKIIIDNLEEFNVFDVHFLQAFKFFYNNYDEELPEDYKTKLFNVLSDVKKIENDLKVKREHLKGLEIEKLSNYIGNLKAYIQHEFTLENIFKMTKEEAIKTYEESIERNDLANDHDLVIFYSCRCKALLEYFSTEILVVIKNPFIQELIEKKDKRASNLKDEAILELYVNAFDVKYIEEDLKEFIPNEYYE